MIDIKIIDEKFKVKGSFDIGYAGLYKNKDYFGKKIEIIHDVSEVIENWDIIKSRIDNDKISDATLEKCLTDYFNQFEEKVQKNIKQVNDNFLINIFSGLSDIGYPFWEHDEIIIKDAMPKGLEEDFNELIYKPYWDEIDALSEEFYDVPNDGSKKKPDVESAIRKMFPMFDLDRFIKGVVPDILCLNDGRISFQCNDSLDCSILCAAYDELDEELTFNDWHNF